VVVVDGESVSAAKLGWLIWVHLGKGPQLYKFTTIKKEKMVRKMVKALKDRNRMVFTYSRGWSNMAQEENNYENKETEVRVQDELEVWDESCEWGPEQADAALTLTKEQCEELDEQIKYDRDGPI
jgi:hypothetical protein